MSISQCPGGAIKTLVCKMLSSFFKQVRVGFLEGGTGVLKHFFCAISAVALTGSATQAANFSDPDWPCIQRKVETISVGQMWPYAIEATAVPSDSETLINDLVARLSLRRTSLEEAETHVVAFVKTQQNVDAALLGHIFQRVFEGVSQRRKRIMAGIGRYARKQAALSQKIEQTLTEMKRLNEQEKPDFDKIDALEEKLDWDRRIFDERAKSLTYVCETPVLLEKRIYAIGQILLRHLPQ